MNLARLIELVAELELPTNDYVIFGSGPLLARGIIDDVADVDILVRGPAWELATRLGELVTLTEHGVSVVSVHDGAVTIGTRWAIGDVDTDEVIDSAETMFGLRFAALEHVVAYKTIANRPKDLQHLELLASWHDRAGSE